MYKKNLLYAGIIATMVLTGCHERILPSSRGITHIQKGPIDIAASANRLPYKAGQDIEAVRFGKHQKSERLVLDLNNCQQKAAATKALKPNPYTYSYDPQSKRIKITLKKASRCSPLHKRKNITFKHSTLIKSIVLSHHSSSRCKTVIYLKHRATIKVYSLTDPARIVIDLTPSS